MPGAVGLGQAMREPTTSPRPVAHLAPDAAGDLPLPAALLAQAGPTTGDELIGAAGPEGLRLTTDALREVYVRDHQRVQPAACAACIRNAWAEPLGHMPLARFERSLDGLPGRKTQRDEEPHSSTSRPTPSAGPSWRRCLC